MCICNKMRFLHIIVSKNGAFWHEWWAMVLSRIASLEMPAFALPLPKIALSVGCAATSTERGGFSGRILKIKKS